MGKTAEDGTTGQAGRHSSGSGVKSASRFHPPPPPPPPLPPPLADPPPACIFMPLSCTHLLPRCISLCCFSSIISFLHLVALIVPHTQLLNSPSSFLTQEAGSLCSLRWMQFLVQPLCKKHFSAEKGMPLLLVESWPSDQCFDLLLKASRNLSQKIFSFQLIQFISLSVHFIAYSKSLPVTEFVFFDHPFSCIKTIMR